MAVVGTVTAGISGSVEGNLTSLAAVATGSETGAVEPLLLTDADSSSTGVYVTIINQFNKSKSQQNVIGQTSLPEIHVWTRCTMID